MISLLGALLGFLGSLLPDIMKLVKDRSDKVHELAIMDRQLQQALQLQAGQLKAIDTMADVAESSILHQSFHSNVPWVEALNGSVRPVLAYAFFLLYAVVKMLQVQHMPWLLWTDEDQAIFSGIISFYFGQRAMQKFRAKR